MQRIDAAAYPADPFEGIVTDRNMVGQATGVAIEPLQHTVSADGTGAGNVIDRADDALALMHCRTRHIRSRALLTLSGREIPDH